jgi:hypothetical protein
LDEGGALTVINSDALFSASQIGAALGRSRWGIVKALRHVEHAGYETGNGQKAHGWRWDQLPEDIRAELLRITAARHFRDVGDLLTLPPEPWQPIDKDGTPLKAVEISQESYTNALTLKRALKPTMERSGTCGTIADIEAQGLADYRKAFGYSISSRHWRTLVDRILERDRGAEDWERDELYLPKKIKRKGKNTRRREIELPILKAALKELNGKGKLTTGQKDRVWLKACDQASDLIDEQDVPEREAKSAVLMALDVWGYFGGGESLRRSLNRKWDTYVTNRGKPLRDGRRLRYAKIESPLTDEDHEILLARSLECGGRVTQAFREAREDGELSPQVMTRFTQNPSSKYYLPNSVRREIRPEVDRLMDIHHGPRQHQLNGAHFSRNYNGMFAGDSFTADDCTCPVYYWEPDPTAPEGYRILRGQLILMVDERVMLALGYSLNSEPTYNSRIIRSLITNVHDSYGLPRRFFRFENGIWRAKILNGDEVEAADTEEGLREYGIQVRHVKLPRGKIIENVLGTVQNQMERLPGYAGRDERNDHFERVQKKLRDARNGGIHPSTFLMSKNQWTVKLDELLEKCNKTTKEGKMLDGLSPLEGWNQLQSDEPLVRLGGQMRYLMAHHKVPMTVRKNMITLRESLGGGSYCDTITGRYNGEKILVWCDPENPDYIAITSPDRKEGPFVIKRLDDLPPLDATREQMAAGTAQINAAQGYAKTVYRSISARLATHRFRNLFADPDAIRQGEEMASGIAQVRAEKKKTRADAHRLKHEAQELGVRITNVKPEALERTARGLQIINDALARGREEEAAATGDTVVAAAPATVKNYALKTAPVDVGIEQLRKAYWGAWNQVERVMPGADRSAITRQALGFVRHMKDLTAEQLRTVMKAFSNIVRSNNHE